jgi:hypothetical protein
MNIENEKPFAFQQTLPKPLYNELEAEAKKQGLRVQELIRFILINRQKTL